MRSYVIFRLLSLLLVSLILSSVVFANENKIALVIGNSDYKHAVPLKNPVNDALDMAKALKNLNFEVRLLTDANKSDIDRAAEEFVLKLVATKGVGMFFYAGHGSQLEGDNYLIPVDTYIEKETEIKDKGFNIAVLMSSMKKANNLANIIVLDACRDNPFTGGFHDNSRSLGENSDSRGLKNKSIKLSSGLSKLDAPPNTILAFATAPGRVAKDGEGRNSPYTEQLIEKMQMEGITVEQVFKEVRAEVIDQTNGQQVPWESSSLVSDFYFVEKKAIPLGW